MNNKGADQIVQVHSLISTFVVHIEIKQVFLLCGSNVLMVFNLVSHKLPK